MSIQDAFLDLSHFQIYHHIGSGGFSEVYRVKNVDTGHFYAAKVSNFIVDEETEENSVTLSLFREINLISLLNHPSILKFIGYSQTDFEGEHNPTIITEYVINGSLRNIIELEDSGFSPEGWNSTKKLINIYGIASGMAYLHSHNIIHRDLKPENILMDDFLYPKISDFGLSKITDFISISMNKQSQRRYKGTPIYMAPEIFENENYSKSSDVYAFSILIYEMITLNKPYLKWSLQNILHKVALEGYRPEIDEDVPDCYRQLIEKCWSKNPDDRPSFESIINELKTNEEFISGLLDESEFFDYVDFIDNCYSSFGSTNKILHFSDFIKIHGRNKTIKRIEINLNDKEKSTNEQNVSEFNLNDKENSTNEQKQNVSEFNVDFAENNMKLELKTNRMIINFDDNINDDSKPQKIIEYASSMNFFIIPLSDFNKFDEKCKILVNEAKNDIEKQFIVGQSLLDELNNFPQNVNIGLQYIVYSKSQNCLNSILYYNKMLIKGNIIQQDLQKAKENIEILQRTNDPRIFILNGMICKKERKFKEARYYFNEGLKNNLSESTYKYAKMLFIGEGGKKSEKEAFKYFDELKNKGYKKSEKFIEIYSKLKNTKGFKWLSTETQYIFIKNIIKQKNKDYLNTISFQPNQTELLFFNNALKSSYFINYLFNFKEVLFELLYPSQNFQMMLDLISKIKLKKMSNLHIGLVFSDFSQNLFEIYNSTIFSSFRIDSSIHFIPERSFYNFSSLKSISIPFSITEIGSESFRGCSSLYSILIPSSVTVIGNYAFSECISIVNISIPSSVIKIGDYIFSGCSSLVNVTIPSSITEIPSHAFENCSSLRHVIAPSSLIKTIGDYSFNKCLLLTEISIPSSVVKIGKNAFYESSIKELQIPSSVTEIGMGAFEYSPLRKVSFESPSSLNVFEKCIFSSCASLTDLIIPPSVTRIKSFSLNDCFLLVNVQIPSSVTIIEDHVFYRCYSLKEIVIPSSVVDIGDSAFEDCKSLMNISLNCKIKKISSKIFYRCYSLTQITLPPSVIEIGSNAFLECKSLTFLSIPSSLTEFNIDYLNNEITIEKY